MAALKLIVFLTRGVKVPGPYGPSGYMVVFLNRGPQFRPQNIIVLIKGTPKMVPQILGNPHIGNTKKFYEVPAKDSPEKFGETPTTTPTVMRQE